MTLFIELNDDIDRPILINVAKIVSIAPLYEGSSAVWLEDGRMIVVKMPYEFLSRKLGIE